MAPLDSETPPGGGPDDLVSDIVRTVARAENVAPIDLSPLYDAVDPEALTDAVARMDEGVIAFEYRGWTVEVTADGRVALGEHRSRTTRFELRCVTCEETVTFESLETAQTEFNAHAEERHQVELVNLDTDPPNRPATEETGSPGGENGSRPDDR